MELAILPQNQGPSNLETGHIVCASVFCFIIPLTLEFELSDSRCAISGRAVFFDPSAQVVGEHCQAKKHVST